jgi:adenosine/AMP kinase
VFPKNRQIDYAATDLGTSPQGEAASRGAIGGVSPRGIEDEAETTERKSSLRRIGHEA